ncbi:MAG: hypothetical protein PW791_12335 [Neorhizobium sp.]|nr:hypothetical protein [Neorhizobium sp.]
MDGLILLLYAVTLGGVIAYTTGLDLRELRFADGIFIGLLFFMLIPLLIAFVDGEIGSIDMRAGPFRPLQDTATSLQLCIGCATVMAFHWFARRSGQIGRRPIRRPGTTGPLALRHPEPQAQAVVTAQAAIPGRGEDEGGHRPVMRRKTPVAHRLLPSATAHPHGSGALARQLRLHGSARVICLFVAAYMVCNIYSFISSGKLDGGHWQGNLETSLQSNVLLIVIGNFANVYRGAVFGILYNAFGRGLVSRGTVVLVGLFVVVFDVVTTFNRITAAYYAIVLILLYRRHFPVMLVAAIPLLPVVGYLSIVWSALRGLALVDGYSLTGFVNAMAAVNTAVGSGQIEIGRSTNGIFDSENIIVFDWLVKNTGDSFPLLYGYTFLLRPLTVLIPSTIWPDKPGVFGIMVGSNLQGIPGLALNSTLFGEAFGNFSYAWPLALFGMLALLNSLYGAFARRFPFAHGAGFFVGFALWRFDMAFAFISLIGLAAFVAVLFAVDLVLDSRPDARPATRLARGRGANGRAGGSGVRPRVPLPLMPSPSTAGVARSHFLTAGGNRAENPEWWSLRGTGSVPTNPVAENPGLEHLGPTDANLFGSSPAGSIVTDPRDAPSDGTGASVSEPSIADPSAANPNGAHPSLAEPGVAHPAAADPTRAMPMGEDPAMKDTEAADRIKAESGQSIAAQPSKNRSEDGRTPETGQGGDRGDETTWRA